MHRLRGGEHRADALRNDVDVLLGHAVRGAEVPHEGVRDAPSMRPSAPANSLRPANHDHQAGPERWNGAAGAAGANGR
ncbi:hypothetical protein [Xylophilus sp.]|uniref:hypothetical protein n=1 Tax=Xylophilus sp. TaxID=2653893 RepID=UPI002D80EBF9|nr:hypothetical protein [Xylophilus sp.]